MPNRAPCISSPMSGNVSIGVCVTRDHACVSFHQCMLRREYWLVPLKYQGRPSSRKRVPSAFTNWSAACAGDAAPALVKHRVPEMTATCAVRQQLHACRIPAGHHAAAAHPRGAELLSRQRRLVQAVVAAEVAHAIRVLTGVARRRNRQVEVAGVGGEEVAACDHIPHECKGLST